MARKKNGGGNGHEAQAPQEQANGTGGTRKPPVHEVRLGRIRSTVWENFGDDREVWYSVTISRSYKDSKDEWRTATSFSGSDILVVAEVARLAYLWVTSQTVTVRTPLPQVQQTPSEEVPV